MIQILSRLNSQQAQQSAGKTTIHIQGFGTARHQATVEFGREPLGQTLLKGEGRLGHKARQSTEHKGYLSEWWRERGRGEDQENQKDQSED